MEERTYECCKCDKVKKAASPPDCCGRKMKPTKLPACTSVSAEQSRPMDEEGPCDDSTGG